QPPPGVDPGTPLRRGDVIQQVGDWPVITWPDLLAAPHVVSNKVANPSITWPWLQRVQVDGSKVLLVQVRFARAGSPGLLQGWCVIGPPPIEEVMPTLLWFLLNMSLFAVGALVLWKRPMDDAAVVFFLLCIVTLGAFTGGYHWNNIVTKPLLLIAFMTCGV